MTKLEKLEELLLFLEKNCRAISECFARTKDYETANRYQREATTYRDVLMYIHDEEFLDKQLKIFENINL